MLKIPMVACPIEEIRPCPLLLLSSRLLPSAYGFLLFSQVQRPVILESIGPRGLCGPGIYLLENGVVVFGELRP